MPGVKLHSGETFSSAHPGKQQMLSSIFQDLPVQTCSVTACGRNGAFCNVPPAQQPPNFQFRWELKEGEEKSNLESEEERVGLPNLQSNVTI